MIRVGIVDDDDAVRAMIRSSLEAEPDVRVVMDCASGSAGLAAIRETAPDLVFLDVEMPDLDGFDVAQAGGRAMPLVIFITAHGAYAARAFDIDACDFLVKPFTTLRLRDAVARARVRLGRTPAGAPAREYVKRFTVKDRDRFLLLRTDQVDSLEACGNYVRLNSGSAHYLIHTSMAQLEDALDPQEFVRIHRSRMVNVKCIREIHPGPSGDFRLVLTDAKALRLSRRYRDRLGL